MIFSCRTYFIATFLFLFSVTTFSQNISLTLSNPIESITDGVDITPVEPYFPPRDEFSDGYSRGDEDFDDYHSGIFSTTYIKITTGSESAAGSNAPLMMKIGSRHTVILKGIYRANRIYTFNFENNSFYESMDTDAWDNIKLFTNSNDGVYIKHVKIKHNNYTILDTDVNSWVDIYRNQKIVFDAEIAMKKWGFLNNTRNTILYHAVMDIGKSGAKKYVNKDTKWCSEFVSHIIREATSLETPKGSIGVTDLFNYFTKINKAYTKKDIEDGKYSLEPGDYVSVNDRGHSTFFVEWEDQGKTKFKTISGNSGRRVRIKTYEWSDVKKDDVIGAIPLLPVNVSNNVPYFACTDIPEWSSDDNWTTYTVGDKRSSNGVIYQCINVGYSYYDPSGDYGYLGWEEVGSCQ